MIRLQPQAERLQKDIQELREELQLRQLENEEETSRLHQASAQISELNAQVQHAEKEQNLLTVKRENAEEQMAGHERTELEVAEAYAILNGELVEVQEEHEEQLQALAQAESESHRYWEKLEDSTVQSEDLASRLQHVNASLEDLCMKSKASQEARTRLRGAWAEAVELATWERGQVEAANKQIALLRSHGAMVEQAAAELCDQAVATEEASSALWQDMAKVEGQDERRDKLADSLRNALAEHEELRAHIYLQEEYDGELLASLNESEVQRASVSDKLQLDALQLEELKASIRETQEMAARLYKDLGAHSEGFASVKRRRSAVEEGGQKHLADLRSRHEEHAGEASSLEAKARELEDESAQLQKDIQGAQQQKENLITSLATKEEQHQAQLARKVELNTELEELKKQCRCTVC